MSLTVTLKLLFKVVTFNGTEKHYVVTVNRAYNKDRPYIELPIEIYNSSTGAEESRYTLSSDFYHSEHAYYLNVPNDTSEVWVKATVGSEEVLQDSMTALNLIMLLLYQVTSQALNYMRVITFLYSLWIIHLELRKDTQ